MIERAGGVLEIMASAVASSDLLTARYAAATITELGDRIETALLAIDRDAKAIRVAITAGGAHA